MSNSGTTTLREVDEGGRIQSRGNLDLSSGRIMDDSGKVIGQMVQTGEHEVALSDYAARCYYSNVAQQIGRPVTMMDRDGEGVLVPMDLSQGDVHTDFAMPNYAAGYKLAEGVADLASPVIVTPHASNKFNTWNSSNAFKRVLPNVGSAGAGIQEVNPSLSQNSYSTLEYSLGAFISTNVQANADAPLNIYQAAIKRVMNALILEREIRVATLMQTSGTWDASLVQTIAAGAKWNGGATSDPIANIFTAMDASALPITDIFMSEKLAHAFMLNPLVQSKIAYKSGINSLPSATQLSAILELPKIHVAKMKYQASGTALSYVWGNSVVLTHAPTSNPPTDQEDVASNYTFRWNGGMSPDGAVTAGMMVRTFFDPKRGGRGGTMCIVTHNDAEKQTSTLVGGLLLNAYQ